MAWEYQELLNQNLQILLTLALGFVSVYLKFFNQRNDLKTFNTFVFGFLLPSSVLYGLGFRSNLRDASLWRFVGGFLLMRAICLVGSFLIFYRRGIGYVTANWLCVSWVSTVILGVPLVRAALGAQYSNLGLVAGISSFIFQLPVMLIFFELHAGKKVIDPELGNSNFPPAPDSSVDAVAASGASGSLSQPKDGHGASSISGQDSIQQPRVVSNKLPPAQDGTSAEQRQQQEQHPPTKFISKSQGKKIAYLLLTNPILWAILLGIILSVTTLGPRYLNPGTPPTQPNCDYAIGTGFIALFFSTLAACTEPVALFATGIFLVHRNPLAVGIFRTVLYMIVKLVLVPALMVGCAAAVGLEGATARASVLLAALPISAAAFSLCDRYQIGSDEAMVNVFWGNLLVLPTTIAWMSFMDAVDLFPAPKPVVPNVCGAAPPPKTG